MSYRGPWKPDEVEILRRLYPKAPKNEILRALPRCSWYRILNKASQLKLSRKCYFWSEEELAILKEVYSYASKEKILRALPRCSWDAIQDKAELLKIKRSRWVYLSEKSMLIPSLVDTVYTAGILDGEGSIGIWIDTKRRYLHPLVTISNNYVPLLKWLIEVLGIGHFNKVGERTYQWRIMAINDILPFLGLLLPYLKIKKKQAELLIEFCELEKQNIIEYVSNNKRPYSSRQWNIYKELKQLNGRSKVARAAPPLEV